MMICTKLLIKTQKGTVRGIEEKTKKQNQKPKKKFLFLAVSIFVFLKEDYICL